MPAELFKFFWHDIKDFLWILYITACRKENYVPLKGKEQEGLSIKGRNYRKKIYITGAQLFSPMRIIKYYHLLFINVEESNRKPGMYPAQQLDYNLLKLVITQNKPQTYNPTEIKYQFRRKKKLKNKREKVCHI